MSRFINICMNVGNARKSYNMKHRKYKLLSVKEAGGSQSRM